MAKIVAVVALAAGGWFMFGNKAADTDEASPNYHFHKDANPMTPAQFSLSDIDRARTDAARDAALKGNPIPGVTNPSPAFIDAARNGKVTFYAVRAYDTCVEDGDVVTFRLPMGGEIGPIPLTKAGTVVSIPVVEGAPAYVTVVGVKDGVGGITVGVVSSGGTWYSKVMAPGESENMLLAVR